MNTLSIAANVATFGRLTAAYTRDARETAWGIDRIARFDGCNCLVSRAIAEAYNRTLPRRGEMLRDGNAYLVVDGYTSLGD